MNRTFVWGAMICAASAAGNQAEEKKPVSPQVSWAQIPLAFEPNVGQSAPSARFLAHGAGYSVQLGSTRATLDFASHKNVTIDLEHANPQPEIGGELELPGKAAHFQTSDPNTWFTNIPTYSRVRYADVYPGIGLAFYGNQNRLEYDFVVQPGADPGQIRMKLAGSEKFGINESGDLVLQPGDGGIRLLKPVAYQMSADGKTREIVRAGYSLYGTDMEPGLVSFSLGGYDRTRPLIIDPVVAMIYSTYVNNYVDAVAVDSSGNTYVTGTGYPYTVFGFYVTKFSPSGTVLYNATVGTSVTAYPLGIAIDSTGRAYVAGQANSGLPTTASAYRTTDPGGQYNTFLSVLATNGASLAYSTYLGGTDAQSYANGVAVDSSGKAYLAGLTYSSGFPGGSGPTAGAYQTTWPGGVTGFVAKMDPSQSGSASLSWATFLGPSNTSLNSIAVDSLGNPYVTGFAYTGFPVTAGAFAYTGVQSASGGVYATKLNATGSALSYSAYLGYGTGYGIAVDGQGSAYVTGEVQYADFPTTSGAYQTTYAGGFLTKLSPDGSSETYSTFLGGPSSYIGGTSVIPFSISLQYGCASSCSAYVSGITNTIDFPAINAVQTFPSSSQPNAFVTELAADGHSALLSTYLSGLVAGAHPGDDGIYGLTPALAVDSSANISVIENVYGNDFPISIPGTPYGGVLAKIGPAAAGFTWATPTTINFGNEPVGVSTSIDNGTQIVTLRNLSNTAVTLQPIVVAPASLFSESDNCAGSIPAGGYCTLDVNFTPAAPGLRTGTITIASNASNSPITIALSGTGYDSGFVQAAPGSLTFGAQPVGTPSSPQFITLTNLGDQTAPVSFAFSSADFTQLNNCPTQLAPGASCMVRVTFIPTQVGLRTDNLYIYNSGNPTSTVPVSGTGTVNGNPTGLLLSAASLDFGTQTVGTTSPQQYVYITNTSAAPVTLQSFAVSGDFALNSTNCGSLPASLAPQTACYVYLTFTPTAAGIRTGALTITDTTPGSPHTVSLSGVGQAATQSLEFYPGTAIVFPDQPVGTFSSNQTVYAYNTGASSLTVDRVQVSGDFRILSTGCNAAVLAGATPGLSYSYCAVTVAFMPTATGLRTGALTFLDSAPGSPHVLNLSGNGITATGAISLTPSQITFPTQAQGTTSAAQYLTLTNPGNSPVTVTGVATTGDYAITSVSGNCGTPPYVFYPGYYCYIYVAFTPTGTANPRTGTLTVTSSAGSQSASLSGTGVAASQAIGITPTALAFGSFVIAQSSGNYYLYVRNTGTTAVTFTAEPTITGANASNFTYSYTGCAANGTQLGPNTSCYIYVSFTPSAAGARSATLTLTDSAGTQTVALSGTGVSALPAQTLSSYELAFDTQVVGTTSPLNNYIYLTNNSASSVVLGNIAFTGDFMVPSGYDACSGATLAANGGNCYTYVVFAPTAAGYRTGSLTFKKSNGTTIYSVPLAGYATAQALTAYISPGSLSFPSQVVNTTSAAQTVYLYNSGNLPLTVATATGINTIIGTSATGEFSTTSGGGYDQCSGTTVQPGSSCYVNVTFTPSAAGARSGSFTLPVTYADSSTATFTATLTGTGVAEQNSAVLSPAVATFLDQVVGIPSNYTDPLTLTNSGNRSFTVGTLTGTNTAVGASNTGEFSAKSNGGSDGCSGVVLAPASSCYVYVAFTPSASGTRAGSIAFPVTYADNTTASPTATLSGNGVAVGKTVQITPSSVQFVPQIVSTISAAQTIYVTNTGNVPVQIGSDVFTGNFSTNSDGCAGATLQPGGSCSVNVLFTPTATGVRTGTLKIGDNAAGGPHTVTLSGTGVPSNQRIILSQTTVAFGNQPAGSTSSQMVVYVANQGDTPVTISSVAKSGTNAADFQVSNNCVGALSARSSCQISITFAPAANASGARTASIAVTYGAAGSPQTIALTGTAVAPGPAVALHPTSLTFPAQTVGTTSTGQGFSVTNTGTANLTISAVASTNAAEFPIFSDGCSGATLTPGQQCVVGVRFSPTLGGARTGTVTVTDNATGSPQVVTLTGTGTGVPKAAPSPSSLTFTSQNIGTTSPAQTVTLTNPGTDTLAISAIAVTGANSGDFAQTNNCLPTLAPAASCTISVTFSPTASGTRGAAITITDNANNAPGSTQIVTLTGTGVAVPQAAVAPGNLTFGNQNLNSTSTAQTLTLSNAGTGPLTITGIAITGTNPGDFAQTSNCGTSVAAGGSCTISVTFTPTAAGSRAATLTVTDNANNTPGSTQTAALSGTGVAVPSGSIAIGTLSFGNQNVGTTSSPQTATLTNSGSGALTISNVAISGTNAGDFSIGGNTCGTTLNAGASCNISVTFTPAAEGSRSATLTITDNAGNIPGSTQTVSLTGTGIGTPKATVAPPSLVFGNQNVGSSSAAQQVTLTNPGTSALTISNIAVGGTNPGDFPIAANTCGATLGIGASCTVSVGFTPLAMSGRSAALVVTDNANSVPGSTQSVALSGTGLLASASVVPASLTFASQNVGTTSPAQSVTLSNPGNATLTITGIGIGGTNPGDFVPGNTCGGSVAPGGSCTISVTFTPAAAGARSAVLTITDNANNVPGSTQTVTLSGTGNTPAVLTAVSVTPNAGAGTSQTFSFLYSDTAGYADLKNVYALINASSATANACYFYYQQSTNKVFLLNNAGNAVQGSVTPGVAGTVSNSQCTISGTGASVTPSGNNLTVAVPVAFQPAFAGTKTIYMYAQGVGGQTSGSFLARGTWNTTANQAPTNVSVSPSSGSGLSQTFTLTWADPNGYQDLNLGRGLFNSSLSIANACYFYYQRSVNKIYLYNDAGTGVQGSVTPGGAGTVSNTQCTISGTGASATPSGNNLTVAVPITFSGTFTGTKNIYLYALDDENLNSGWQAAGTWTP